MSVNSWPLRGKTPDMHLTKSEINQMYAKVPAKYKRDSFNRRHNNPVISLPSSTSSSAGSIDESFTYFECGSPVSIRSHHSQPCSSNVNQHSYPSVFGNDGNGSFYCDGSGSSPILTRPYYMRTSSERGTSDLLMVPNLKQSHSASSIKSCPEMHDIYHDVSNTSQCEPPLSNKPCSYAQCGCCITHTLNKSTTKRSKVTKRSHTLSHSAASSYDNSVSRRRAALKALPKRPKSFGNYESTVQDFGYNCECAFRRQAIGHSASCLQPSHQGLKLFHRRRPISTSEDIGSISDLGNIYEGISASR